MKEHTYVAVDYLKELEDWISHDYYEENVHKIQLPFTNVSTILIINIQALYDICLLHLSKI